MLAMIPRVLQRNIHAPRIARVNRRGAAIEVRAAIAQPQDCILRLVQLVGKCIVMRRPSAHNERGRQAFARLETKVGVQPVSACVELIQRVGVLLHFPGEEWRLRDVGHAIELQRRGHAVCMHNGGVLLVVVVHNTKVGGELHHICSHAADHAPPAPAAPHGAPLALALEYNVRVAGVLLNTTVSIAQTLGIRHTVGLHYALHVPATARRTRVRACHIGCGDDIVATIGLDSHGSCTQRQERKQAGCPDAAHAMAGVCFVGSGRCVWVLWARCV
mmetsp:Transcript_10186/g.25562  ORF Transcript_10186/g.25562 Transcript_10186/m.25562 type:complete len:274 (+) Transcript_10186:904-1725(+)